ncbi:hypothetical protein ACI1IE_002117 [Vibrio vulnificus]|nr:hypothetical protein [Vibrio vulnificus]
MINKYILIGNRGSFLNDFEAKMLLANLDFEVYATEDYQKCIINIDNRCCVIYIGGETRDASKMEEYNYIIPKTLYIKSCSVGAFFLYLSSLSVFGYQSDDKVSVYSSRFPIDTYGITKNKLDLFVMKYGYSLNNVCIIYPASICSGKGRSSIEKFGRLMAKFPLLKFFKLQGNLSYIEREKLIDGIILSSMSRVTGQFIYSDHRELSYYSFSYAIKIPKITYKFFDFVAITFSNKLSLMLKTLNRGIIYENK